MDIETQQQTKPAQPAYTEMNRDGEERRSPAGFAILATVLIAVAAVGGAVKSGKISLNGLFGKAKSGTPEFVSVQSTQVAHPQALQPGTFVVTSISLTEPSFAIINGISRAVGAPLEAPGVTGWKVARIMDGSVVVQNGATYTTLPLTTPEMKALDDNLKPLN